jgi:hypothetical protein
MVDHRGEYRWPSYGHNAQGLVDASIRPHALYTGLGSTAPLRQEAYRELFRYQLDPGLGDQIRTATHGGFVLGGTISEKDRCNAWSTHLAGQSRAACPVRWGNATA